MGWHKKSSKRLIIIMLVLIAFLPIGNVTAYGGYTKEILFIDDALPDYKVLMDSVPDWIQVIVLDGKSDGIEEMAKNLKTKRGFDAIHIVSHGGPGKVRLGTALLKAQTLESYSKKFKIIGQSLKETGDILLYGCDVARGESGKQFVKEIARITGADVAASENGIGSAELGGNWVLEYQAGIIDTRTDLFANLGTYPFLLDISEILIHTYPSNTWAFNCLAVGPDGTIYLAHKVSNTEIAVKYWSSTSWISLPSITTSASGDTGFSDDINLTVDSNNKLHIAFRHHQGSGVTSHRGVKYGVYNGTSWQYSEVEAYSHPSGGRNFDDPAIVVDSTDAAHMVYKYVDSTGNHIQYATNSSGSWVVSTLAIGLGGTDEIHNPRIVIDENDIIHISYVREDNQNDYYGNYYYTSKLVEDTTFPSAQKLIDAVAEGKSYYYSSLISNGSALYFTYYNEVYNESGELQNSTSYIHTNKSGSWQREQIYFDSERITGPVGIYVVNSNLYLLMDSWAEDWSENYYFAMANYGSVWITGTKTISPTLLNESGYASEIRFMVDAAGDFMLVMLTGDLKKIGSLTGTSDDFGLSISAPVTNHTAEASASILTPVIGVNTAITLTVKDSLGNTDANFNGAKNVTISGTVVAPNGSYGEFNSVALDANSAGAGQVISVTFTNGVATANLKLNKAGSQAISFLIGGVTTPATNTLAITPAPGAAASMTVTQDITAPASNGGSFAQQPKITLKDIYGNICTTDSATVVTAVKEDAGSWTLTGTATATASLGVATFTDLGATNTAEVSGAHLGFTAEAMTKVTSGTVTLPVAIFPPVFTSAPVSISYTDTPAYDTLNAQSGTLIATDENGDTITYGIQGGTVTEGVSTLTGTYGTLAVTSATGSWIYTPSSASINAVGGGTSPTDTFTVTAYDGTSAPAATQTFIVTINGANDTPVFTNLGGTPVAFTEGGAAVQLDCDVSINDAELDASSYNGASLTILRIGGVHVDDVFSHGGNLGPLNHGGNLTLSGLTVGTVHVNSAGTLMLTFNANADTAKVTEVMRWISYSNSSKNPPATVQLDWIFSDGELTATGTTTVHITPVNNPPEVDLNGPGGGVDYTATFSVGGGAVAIAPDASIIDWDNTYLTTLTATLTNLPNGNDESMGLSTEALATAVGNGLTVTYSAGSGVLSVTGWATVEDYQTVLRGIQYHNSAAPGSADPTDRVITIVAGDGEDASTARTATVNVRCAPIVDLNGAGAGTGYTGTFTEDGGAVAISSCTIITDGDDANLQQLVVTLTNAPNGAAEGISIPGHISGTVYYGTGITVTQTSANVLTMTGSAPKESYAQVIDAIRYNNTSQAPDTTARSITVVATDDRGDVGAASIATISVVPVNDAPSLSGDMILASVNEDTANPPGATINSMAAGLFSDPDNAAETISGVAVIGNAANTFTQGLWQYSTDSGSTWYAVGTVSDGADALAVPATALLRFVPAADYYGTPGALSVRALDSTCSAWTSGATRVNIDTTVSGGTTAIAATARGVTTSILPVNDPPTLTAIGGTVNFIRGGAPVGLFSDAVVSAVEAGQSITELRLTVTNVASGTEFLRIDGSNVALTHGTTGTTSINSFGYSVAVSGGTATVTITRTDTTINYAQLINGLEYGNTAAGTDGNARVVTIIRLHDNGGTANGGQDNATFSITATVNTPAGNHTAEAGANTLTPVVGTVNAITITVKDSFGYTDTNFNGEKNVTITGVEAAPDGTYGSFSGTTLDETSAAGGQVISVTFTNGVATPDLALNNSGSQTIAFSIATVTTPATNILTIIPTPGAVAAMTITQDITSPATNGGSFAQQPKITLIDIYGNICTNNNATVVTAAKEDAGSWTLTGTANATTSAGVATFTNLGATNSALVHDAQLGFMATGLTTVTSAPVILPAPAPSGGGSNTTLQPSQASVIVFVNGEAQNAGKETISTEHGQAVVTVEVNNKVIEGKIDEAVKNNPTGTRNIIQVPIADKNANAARVELTGDIVKKLESSAFDVSIKRDNVEYIIPAEEFTIRKAAKNLGILEKDFQDIKVEVKITKLDQAVVEKYNEVAKANGAELVFPPVSFAVVAKTVKADGTTGEVGISKFSNYVERIMEIPAGVDPSKVTTGIVFNADGSYSHVPTSVYQKDGKWYASLNSLTNSSYSVIWNPVTVKSVANHWAKDAVNDMASRLVIFNAENFDPDMAITRADFAEYIVRALGLYREGSTQVNKFSDVSATDDRTMAILIASEYGIVTGYPDSSFRPDALITRDEAMAMYQRAMKITKLRGSDVDRYLTYTDFANVSSWATGYVKEVLAAHVFNGTTTTTISPKSNLTYAEAAQAVKNLLVQSELINK